MAAGRYTSRVFVASDAIMNKLNAVAWPPHRGEPPVVSEGDQDPDMSGEIVALTLNPEASGIEWRRVSPAGADEFVSFDVTHRITKPNMTAVEVKARLAQIAELIQGIAYDTATEAVVPFGFDGEVLSGLAQSVQYEIAPGSEGRVGACVVSFRLQAQI